MHGAVEDDAEHRHSHQHVQPVQAGHEEVERPVHGRAGKVDLLVPVEAAGQLVLVEMRGVLDRLDAEEGEREHDRDRQADHRRARFVDAGEVNRQRDGQRAADEHQRVDGPRPDLAGAARLRERRRKREPVHGIGDEEAREE